MTIAAGTRLGRYEIRSQIGAGGMGEVYCARDTTLDRAVALKILPAEVASHQERMRRFIQEARAAATLNHPNTAHIYEIGESEATRFIAMEYIDGLTLRQKMSVKELKLGEILDIAVQTASGLTSAHQAGVVHRDIKPGNIMMRNDGYIKILDFGLAKLTEKPGASTADSAITTQVRVQTDPGTVMGTVHYMSPEQARGLEVDARTDIFSLGVVLYQMITRRLPFEGSTDSHVIVSILDREPAPLAKYSAKIPPELEWIVGKALAKEREKRYQTVRDMLADLKSLKQRLDFEVETERFSLAGASTEEARAISDPQAITEIAREPANSPSDSGRAASLSRRRRSRKVIKSLAVLPLANAGGDADAEYLSDGITESLINNLSQLPKLRVMARATVFRYKGQEVDPQEVGRKLNTHAVLMGRVLHRDDRLIIKMELIDCEDGSHLWGEQYNRRLTDIFAVEEEITREISEHLRLKLSTGEKKRLAKRYTESTEAYQLYLKGRYFWNKYSGEGFKKGIEYFQQAIAADPGYALAYAALADSYFFLWWFGYLSPEQSMPKMKAATTRALEIDDALAEAHTSLGRIKLWYEWDWPGAEREFKRAIKLNPNSTDAHIAYAAYLRLMERAGEAQAEGTRVSEIDPLSLFTNLNLGWILFYFARLYDRAIEQGRKLLEIEPSFFGAYWLIGGGYHQKGMIEEALAAYQRAVELGGGLHVLTGLACVYAHMGMRDEALKILRELNELREQKYVPSTYNAVIHLYLGEPDQTFAWLEKAYQERHAYLAFLRVDPNFDSLRADVRFKDLLRRMGLQETIT